MKDVIKPRRSLAALTAAALAFAVLPGCDKDKEKGEESSDIVLEGLSGPVTVSFDSDAVPHIACATANDCVMALGYLHARDRYVQMEVRRSFVRGRLHRLMPSGAALVAPIDQANRLNFLTRDGIPIEEAALAHATPETLALLEAYSAGVNTWLSKALTSSEKLFSDELYYALISRDHISEWTTEDSIATVVALVDGLTNSASDEIANGNRLAMYGEDLMKDLIFPRPVADALTLNDSYIAKGTGASVTFPDVSSYQDLLLNAGPRAAVREMVFGPKGDRGSNNWAVHADRSKSGNALLSDDPHLGHTNPATWYLAEMHAADGSLHVAGVTFAGLPWVILGQNEKVAWGATTTYFDQADVYLETLNDDCDAVIFNGEEVPLIPYDNKVEIGTSSFPRTDYVVPHHGPILEMDCDAKTAVSFRWTGQDLSTDVNFLNDLSRSGSVEQAREALLKVTTLGQNWVVIDTEGNIGWYPYNRLPVRDTSTAVRHPALPLPGDGTAEWIDWIAYEDLPQMTNPAEGYIATANNDMTGELYVGLAASGALHFQSQAADGLRQERIRTLLESTTEHTQATMLSTVGDTYLGLADYVLPGLEGYVGGNEAEAPNAAALLALVSEWDGTCPTGLASSDPTGAASSDAAARDAARGCLVMHRWIYDLRVAIFADEITAAGGTNLATLAALTDLLTGNSRLSNAASWWDNVATSGVEESALDTIEAAATSATQWIEGKLGADREAWLWGRLHRVALRADLFPEFGITTYNNGTYALPGGLSTVNVAGPSQKPEDGFDTGHGASMRLICEGFSEGMKCTIQMPGGQRHFRNSPYYANFLERWLTNTPAPLRFNEAIDAVETVTFVAE